MLLAACIAGLVPAAAPAQVMTTEPSPVSFGFGGGLTSPMGAVGNLHGTGWHVEGMVGWLPPTQPVGFRGDISYGSIDGRAIAVGRTRISADDLTLFSITGDVVWYFQHQPATATGNAAPSRWTPYLLGGVGFYRTTGSRTGTSPTTSDRLDEGASDAGINLGAGLLYRLSGFSFFGEVRWHNVFNGTLNDEGHQTSAQYVPFTVGIRVP
jgi:hypothetical protein